MIRTAAIATICCHRQAERPPNLVTSTRALWNACDNRLMCNRTLRAHYPHWLDIDASMYYYGGRNVCFWTYKGMSFGLFLPAWILYSPNIRKTTGNVLWGGMVAGTIAFEYIMVEFTFSLWVLWFLIWGRWITIYNAWILFMRLCRNFGIWGFEMQTYLKIKVIFLKCILMRLYTYIFPVYNFCEVCSHETF